LAKGDRASSAEAYRRALELDPGSFRAHAGLAEALLAARDLDGADEQAAIAKRLMPGDARIRELLDRLHEARADVPQE
jgi:cytochrome c-type biogenesis protein CcmH/NrfG